MNNSEFIVVGGGIIGMTTARELALCGAKVSIFDKGKLGMQASWAAGGIISSMRPWAESRAAIQLSEYSKNLYPEFIEKLKIESGIDPEYNKSGLVIVNKDHAIKTKDWAKSHNIKIEEEFKIKSECLNLPGYSIKLPDIAQVRPPRLLNALRKSLENLGVNIYENTEITELEFCSNKFQSISYNNKTMSADSLIITAGAWCKSLTDKFNIKMDIKPIRGQMLCIEPEQQICENIILDGAHYFIPRMDGRLLIGSTMEDVGYINQTTEEGKADLLSWAQSMFASLSDAKLVSHWSGLRPSTSRSKPFIGQLPDVKNVYINTGHFRKGILQAPASAKILVDSILSVESFMDISIFGFDDTKSALKIA